MLKLREDLKNGVYRRAYLLYGEEPYLLNMYKDRLLKTLADPEDTMNVSRYEGKGINPREIIDLAETLPFFAERRVILIENSGFFKNACEELAAYIPDIPETSVLIFAEEEVDKRGKMFKAVKALGGTAEFRIQKEDVLAKWILQTLKKENKKITGTVLQKFLNQTGTSMENIEKELEKLICYTYGREVIGAEDVEAICCGQTVNRIFVMVDAIAKKEQKQALELYYDLVALREPPMRILFLIVRQFQILMQVKTLAKKGYDRKTIAKRAGVPEFALKKNIDQARHFTLDQVLDAIRAGIQTEEDIKTGKLNDQLGVELLIVTCSSEK
ncbi:MAG TPA: DNA polymerase III subunit delta [Candidatus Eubacterium avistercoris]|uniref:DNA polymerase III subunit delta n=1 Tax=Candidatus Eubacterium avistercoris TaxID=2838567 RepID=A0A9D2D3T6_9FIRM|nr:DNA polymerase III subunit delta [Candidatus Eubacterium avistercoris]